MPDRTPADPAGDAASAANPEAGAESAARGFRDHPVSFVRRSGRMSEAQDRAWSDFAPRYLLDVERDVAATSIRPGDPIDPHAVFGREAPLVVEIGSGQGHAIVHAAAAAPEKDFMAVEVFRAGLARTMLDADRAGVRNLRLVEANAPEVLEHLLPEASVDEIWIFFPDPWHKNKHNKRRLIAPGFPAIAARALRDGGTLRLATDWEDYALQMRDVLSDAADLTPAFDGPWAPRFDGRVLTAFERKGARAGREIRDLAYQAHRARLTPVPAQDLDARRPFVSWAIAPTLLVCLAAPAFFVLLQPWLGWILLAAGLGLAFVVDRRGRDAASDPIGLTAASDRRVPSLLRDLSLIAAGLLVVSLIDLKAELDNLAMLRFTLALGGAVVVPYVISRWVYRDRAISFPWRGGGRWTTFQWAWLAAVLVLGWLILPFYFITSGVYLNWPVVDTPELIARLFVGVGAVGIWDELFFICTVFALLRRHFADVTANVLQAIVFVSFLWELGYRAWGPLLTIPFALLQGFIFLRTRSLAYVVSVHLLFDAVVFLVLVHAHNPGLLDGWFLV